MDNTIDHTFESANRVYDSNAVSPTINTCGGGGLQPKILEKKCISTKGKENEVASTILAGYERTNMTGFNADNAVVESVRIKQATKQGYIECEVGGVADFSFPDSKTRRGRVQENGRVSPTLMSSEQDICRIESVCAVDEQNMNLRHETFGTLTTDGSSPKHNNRVMEIVKTEPKLIGGFGEKKSNGGTQYYQQDRVYSMEGVAMCHPSQIPDGSYKYMEIKRVGQISNDGSQYGTVISENGLSSTLSAGTHGYANNCIQQQYRIRKLTPLECWRLMDFTDEDFYKAAEVNSNTQLYKQAGNSIIRNVLVAILGQLIEGKEDAYRKV